MPALRLLMADPDETDFLRTVFSLPQRPAPAGAPRRLPVLVVLRGAQVGRRYLLNEAALVIGRRPERAQLVIPADVQVSSTHCRIRHDPARDAWLVEDLDSTNGTYVGTERVREAVLRDGDRLLLGETVLKFTFHDELEEEFHRQVDQLMNVDDLTGLPVQRVFQARFQEQLQACRRERRPLSVFMMDMDGLKQINDTHGHLAGAQAIATVGRRLGALVQARGGVVSRFGGDEFSAFVSGLDRPVALQFGEAMRAAVADQPIPHGAVALAPTLSIGVAQFPEHGAEAEALTRHADEALYRAKAAGKNRVSP